MISNNSGSGIGGSRLSPCCPVSGPDCDVSAGDGVASGSVGGCFSILSKVVT